LERPLDQPTLILIILLSAIFLYMGFRIGRIVAEARMRPRLAAARREAADQSRAVLGGQFSEQLAPFLPGFPYSPTEVRFLGKPVDLVVFKGLDDKEPSEIVFVEVKSGVAQLSQVERKLRDVVEAGRVSWVEYRVPQALTRG
jgi:predicted Holliday junction resolvase-like endonuclease